VTRAGLCAGAGGLAVLLVVVVGLSGCGRGPAAPAAGPPAREAPLPPPGTPPAGASPSTELEPVEPTSPPGPVETVTIKLLADVHREAHVFWGRKDLGVAPLELKRPRGSGPVDLLVVAPGALPVHTRVFTDRDESLPLRFYSPKEAAGLLGGRPPEPAGAQALKTGLKTGLSPGQKPTPHRF
jgi:hypothetical protein